ncbi:N-acetylmuramoyl-L-alanine amidase [Bacillus sp. V3-13]|uniref:N-acetylmuramoyl-L-alanine amidase n=1 Tax=Bacillus sp. V3-13 TaxID=2053728 RepID=UPI000C75EF4B|nr:N-acetylmuramoyl-L-alanine amidase [Bacillus sp. V3-13]PLR76202.1 N-acetylmuramoyl-L-alanine amidase [Bacillus sp. V3-13]
MTKIFIDPGHGGTDPGAVGNGMQEKNLTLQISSRIRDILLNEYEGISVLMSRTGDQTTSLSQRTDAANNWGADFYLSIHVNAGGGTGYEDYIYPGLGAPTTTYQNLIHEEVLKQVDYRDRGKKQANLHVLRESNMPAVLTENGFIDNTSDAEKLKQSSFIEQIARGHINGLVRSFGLVRKNPAGPLYRVQIGAFTVGSNADQLAAQAEEKGFDAYISYRDGYYKVQIGAFATRENADQLAGQAIEAGFEAIVIQE